MGIFELFSRIMMSTTESTAKRDITIPLEFDVDNVENGLHFNGHYVPEEVLCLILSHVDDDVLKYSLVCKRWQNIIKSFMFWTLKYKRRYSKKPKRLPWYVYYCLLCTDFFENQLKNTCGEDQYKHWDILKNYGDQFRIEETPYGADPLPANVRDFGGHKSCFATSYYECVKKQQIALTKRPVYTIILDTYKPAVLVSEWVAGRFDCGSKYKLVCSLLDQDDECLDRKKMRHSVEQWHGGQWSKVTMTFSDYHAGVRSVMFLHEGSDTQFWKGHYGSKMAGGVVQLVFESIKEDENDDDA